MSVLNETLIRDVVAEVLGKLGGTTTVTSQAAMAVSVQAGNRHQHPRRDTPKVRSTQQTSEPGSWGKLLHGRSQQQTQYHRLPNGFAVRERVIKRGSPRSGRRLAARRR